MKAINKEILKLAIPSIFANITVPLVGMVDIAVAGHLDADAATLIGAVAVGTMLFDLLYWNFGFLRAGTGGLTAQAYGRGDERACADNLCRSLSLALMIAAVLLAIQWLFLKASLLIVDCSPQVKSLAEKYFYIRIWAAPATLSLMALRGWFIGMQDSVSSMTTDLTVNLVNIAASIVLSLGALGFRGIGFSGIAVGTVAAQYCGVFCACLIILVKYRHVFTGLSFQRLRNAIQSPDTRRFFSMNTDLFVRSLCMLGIYIGFTAFSARYGDTFLAAAAIIMKILMLFSYFTDGFAYAGEAMTGKYIGAQQLPKVRASVRMVFVWSLGIALIFMGIYGFAGVPVIKIMTSDPEVVSVCSKYIPWLLLMPIIGCAAFTWDGIYIGATASRHMRNSMIWAAAGFLVCYWIGEILLLGAKKEQEQYAALGMHILLLAYFVHLMIRTVYLTATYRKIISSSSLPWQQTSPSSRS